jgi:general secretion pathway protein G
MQVRATLTTAKALRTSRAGFSLLEVLVVVAIIVMLAGVGSYYVIQRYEDAQQKAARSGVTKVKGFIENFYVDHGQYPNSLEQLAQPIDGRAPYAKGDELHDPWGVQFQFQSEPEVVVWTQRKGKRISSADPAR